MPYITYHAWKKHNGYATVSDWWADHLVPMLADGQLMGKRFMLYMSRTHQQLWHRICHDYENVWRLSIDRMDARQRLDYWRRIQLQQSNAQAQPRESVG